MTKLFLAPRFDVRQPDIFLVSSYFGVKNPTSALYVSRLPEDYKYTTFTFVGKIEEADYVLIPQGISEPPNRAWREYFATTSAEAACHGKKVIVFAGGDLSHRIVIDAPDTIVFKSYPYGYLLRPNEISMMPFLEDPSEGIVLSPRPLSKKPIVGFCGWAGLPDAWQAFKYYAKLVGLEMYRWLTLRPYLVVHRKGLYWRRVCMQILARSARVATAFIVRDSYSASLKTIRMSPEQARKEYIENMLGSDFGLAPKGDANASIRFFELLALGRVPVLIDTDCVLPLEGIAPYDKAILRVSYKDIVHLPDIIADFYASQTDSSWKEIQENARLLFRDYLRHDSFFNFVFSGPLERLLPKHSGK